MIRLIAEHRILRKVGSAGVNVINNERSSITIIDNQNLKRPVGSGENRQDGSLDILGLVLERDNNRNRERCE